MVEIPPRLAIVGGGVVACEAATWMAALGSRVTMLVRSTLLDRLEPFAADLVHEGCAATASTSGWALRWRRPSVRGR